MPLIAIEGIDAAGKASQIKRLLDVAGEKFGADAVAKHDFPHYSSPTGKVILQLLTQHVRYSSEIPESEMRLTRALILQSLMTTNRLEFVKLLREYEGSDKYMFLDRYYASGLVYGEADGLDFEYLWNIHWTLPAPDLWILVDISPEESVRRRPERRDEYEKRAGFMEKVREGYLRLFTERSKNLPGKWVVIDGVGTPDEVHARILKEVEETVYPELPDPDCRCGGPFSRSHNITRGCPVHGVRP